MNQPCAREASFSFRSKRVALTGRFAALSRRQARELIRQRGGSVTARVSRATSLLVIGQEEWPLPRSRGLSHNLRRAVWLKRQGWALEIVDEQDLLDRLRLTPKQPGLNRHYSILQVCQIIGVPVSKFRAWRRLGLLTPTEFAHGLPWFDFRQLSAARLLRRLEGAGISTDHHKRRLRRLARVLPQQSGFLHRLVDVADAGRLLYRNTKGDLVDLAGQKHFEFADDDGDECVAFSEPAKSAADCFEEGCHAEAAGNLAAAESAYQRAMALEPENVDPHFNLGNVLIAQGRYREAVGCYRQALAIDAASAEVWNNLGVALAELHRLSDACAAFRHALRIDAGYADAHYNLADALDLAGHGSDARRHWREFLGNGRSGQWASFARLRLAEIEEAR